MNDENTQQDSISPDKTAVMPKVDPNYHPGDDNQDDVMDADDEVQDETGKKYKKSRKRTLFDQENLGEDSPEMKHELAKYNKSVCSEYEDMINFTAQNKALMDKNALKKEDPKMRLRQDIFQRRMALECLTPLRNGVSAESLLTATSMFIGLYLGSPNMRKTIAKFKGDRMENKINKLMEKGANPEGFRMQHMMNKRDKYLRKANDGHLPFTAESAALYDLGFKQQCYRRMLNPEKGETIDSIMKSYNEAHATLYEMAKLDGVAADDINAMQRVIVGRLGRQNPNCYDYYAETSLDGVTMSPGHDVRHVAYTNGGKPYMRTDNVWTGEFNDGNGRNYTGGFTPRKPMTKDTFADFICSTMEEHGRAAASIKNPDIAKYECANMSIGATRAFGDEGILSKNVPDYKAYRHTELSDAMVEKYKRGIKYAQADGMTRSEMVAADGLGVAKCLSKTLSAAARKEFKGSGVVMTRMANEYAKRSYLRIRGNGDMKSTREYAGAAVLALSKNGIGPKREKFDTDEAYKAAVRSRVDYMSTLVRQYQGMYWQSDMKGNDFSETEKLISDQLQKTEDVWCNKNPLRMERINSMNEYAKESAESFMKDSTDSAFYRDAMKGMIDMGFDFKHHSKHEDTNDKSYDEPIYEDDEPSNKTQQNVDNMTNSIEVDADIDSNEDGDFTYHEDDDGLSL